MKRGIGQKPETRSIACWNTLPSAGPASPQITITSPAVMSVISTQPGTSPRSERRTERAIFMSDYFLETHLENENAGEDRECNGHRKDEEHERHHHRNFFLSGDLEELALSVFAHILRLRA